MLDAEAGLDWTPVMNPQMKPRLPVRFYQRFVENSRASTEAGRPVGEHVDYIKILTPGGLSEIDTPVTDKHKKEYPEHWLRYKAGKEQLQYGTPLDQWPAMTPTEIIKWNQANIFTVEQLADCPDNVVPNLGMGALEKKTKAQAYLKAAKDGAYVQKLAVENKELHEEIDFLKKEVAELTAAVKANLKEKK